MAFSSNLLTRGESLEQLRRSSGGHIICVQVVRDWRNDQFKLPGERRLVVADEKNFKMAVTIRRPERFIFGDVLKEGKWYWISDFEVNIKYEEQIFSTQSYQIFINNGTRVHEASDINLSRMFSLISFERIERISERINVVDVLGVIVHVKHRQIFEAIERPYGVIPESRSIHFVLKDFNGRELQCIAKDKVCKKFKKMWIRTDLFSQVVCILRLWDISFFQGNFGLIGENEYSDILFDYPCPEVKMAKDRVASSNHFDEIRDGYLEHYKRINMY